MTIKSSIYTTPYVDFHICIYNSCLLFSGADVNEINNAGKSALLIALEDGKFDIAEYLIKHGGDVNTVDHLGQSALFLTMNNNTDHKCIKLLKKLIKAGKVLVSFFYYQIWWQSIWYSPLVSFHFLNICFISYVFTFLGYSFEKDRFWLKDDGFGYSLCSCDKSVSKLLKKLDCSRASLDRSLSTHFPLEFTKVGWTKNKMNKNTFDYYYFCKTVIYLSVIPYFHMNYVQMLIVMPLCQ